MVSLKVKVEVGVEEEVDHLEEILEEIQEAHLERAEASETESQNCYARSRASRSVIATGSSPSVTPSVIESWPTRASRNRNS